MAAILRNLPFHDHPTSIALGGRPVRIKPDQIVVWLSLNEKGTAQFESKLPSFPAILDTGYGHNLLISERHIRDWVGFHPLHLPPVGTAHVSGIAVQQVAANIWLHRNRPGSIEPVEPLNPVLLELSPGIAIVPEKASAELPYPRLPLLGLRAFRTARLRIDIDGRRCRVNVGTSRRFWLFSR